MRLPIQINSAEHEYMPPPPINALVTAFTVRGKQVVLFDKSLCVIYVKHENWQMFSTNVARNWIWNYSGIRNIIILIVMFHKHILVFSVIKQIIQCKMSQQF